MKQSRQISLKLASWTTQSNKNLKLSLKRASKTLTLLIMLSLIQNLNVSFTVWFDNYWMCRQEKHSVEEKQQDDGGAHDEVPSSFRYQSWAEFHRYRPEDQGPRDNSLGCWPRENTGYGQKPARRDRDYLRRGEIEGHARGLRAARRWQWGQPSRRWKTRHHPYLECNRRYH